MRELTHAAAERLAKRLLANAAAWAKTILICVGRRDCSVEDKLASEALAYSFCLLGERLQRTNGADGFMNLVRSCCVRLQDERAWRRTNRHRRLAQATTTRDSSEFSRKLLAHADGTERRFGLSEEAFGEFCRATGLSSSLLFGRGENLAALVFYIVAHGCISAGTPLSRQQTRELLRAARECRLHTESCVANFVRAAGRERWEERSALLSGTPSRRIQERHA